VHPISALSHCCAPRTREIRYFPDTDTLYIALADRVSSSSEAVNDNLIVDFDERGKPVGVQVMTSRSAQQNGTNWRLILAIKL
jgi:uncharacterized protein YuzE